MMQGKISIGILLLAMTSASVAATSQHTLQSEYAGQEKRTIKSLSEDDIQQLNTGKGWGLAKAAELNGMPGPAHVLQMKNEIALTPEQEQQVRTLFNQMKSRAIPLGKQLIELERKLNQSFADRAISEQQLKAQLDAIADVYSRLRYVHLVTHLKTPALLSPQQVTLYNRLRGYSSDDPCSHIPKGHDPEMWKKHNDCK